MKQFLVDMFPPMMPENTLKKKSHFSVDKISSVNLYTAVNMTATVLWNILSMERMTQVQRANSNVIS